MTKHIIKAWHSNPEYALAEDLRDPDRLCLSNSDMRDAGWLCVGEAEVTLTINITEEDLALSMCDTIRQQIQKIQADAHREVNRLQDRINQLQALTYKGGV